MSKPSICHVDVYRIQFKIPSLAYKYLSPHKLVAKFPAILSLSMSHPYFIIHYLLQLNRISHHCLVT